MRLQSILRPWVKVGLSPLLGMCLGILGLALAGQIKIPLLWTPVPLTLQVLVSLLLGAQFGSKRGALAVLAYLGLRACGLPLFAVGTGAWGGIVGPTAGYLMGFVAAAFLVGYLYEKGWGKTYLKRMACMLAGVAVIWGCGACVLSMMVGASAAWHLGVAPFLVVDPLKALIAACICTRQTRSVA